MSAGGTAAEPMSAGGTAAEPLAQAAALSDSLLFPMALDVDSAEAVPRSHLDALAAAGLYGLAGPAERGGLGTTPQLAMAVIERLAGGCLATTFVWLQHHAAVRAVAAAGGALEREWLEPLCRGERRAGVAFAGLRRAGPPLLTAERADSGWNLTGTAPWVTGWGLVDILLVAARVPSLPDTPVLWVLVDALDGRGLSTERLRLEVVDASITVTATFERVFVPDERVVGTEPFEEWRERDAAGLRMNGSLPLGVALRCASLLEGAQSAALEERVSARRDELDAAGPAQLPRARAAAAELALEAATSLVIATGGRAVLRESIAQLLAREAVFLLVFGQTPTIKAEQLGVRGGRLMEP